MPTLNRRQRPLRYTLPLPAGSLRTAIGRSIIALVLMIVGAPALASTPTHAAHILLVAPNFPGPRFGAAGPTVLTPADFSYQCNTGIMTAPVGTAGVTLAAGQAIRYQG